MYYLHGFLEMLKPTSIITHIKPYSTFHLRNNEKIRNNGMYYFSAVSTPFFGQTFSSNILK